MIPHQKDSDYEGWAGKAKGALQVAYERGLLDLEKYDLKMFTLNGTKDPITNEIDLNISLKHLLGEREDFQKEQSQLTMMGSRMGVIVRTTPKTHCEIAGEEGIEYIWAFIKNHYRRRPLRDKRMKKDFHATVKECFKMVTIDMDCTKICSPGTQLPPCVHYS